PRGSRGAADHEPSHAGGGLRGHPADTALPQAAGGVSRPRANALSMGAGGIDRALQMPYDAAGAAHRKYRASLARARCTRYLTLIPTLYAMREMQQYIVIHYGEVSIKGKNRPRFLRRLVQNVRQAVRDLGEAEVQMLAGRCLVAVPAAIPWACLEERLRSVFGIANFAQCLEAPHNLEAIKQTVSRVLHGRTFASFRITARRAFKELPFRSQELHQELGAHVLATHQTRVNLDHPELTLHVHLIPRRAPGDV